MAACGFPMPVERIPEWSLTAADNAAIIDLLARSFDTDFGGRSFFTQPHHLRLVERREGRMVGHMAMLLRSVLLGQQQITIVGLAEVATDPAFRGLGIAAGLLQAAIAEARTTQAPFFLLFGEARLYAAAGFRAVANPVAHVVTKGTRVGRVAERADTSLMVLPLRDEPWPEAALLDLLGAKF